MKSIVITLALAFLCSAANAQQPPRPILRQPNFPQNNFSNADPGQSLPENYVLTLTINEKEQVVTEMSLVVATPEFKTDFPDAKNSIVTFTGTIIPEESGTVLVRYAFAAEIPVQSGEGQVQYKATATQASVRLKAGEPVQIMKTDTRSFRLSIAPLANQPPKTK